jgi:hypothetical protein
MTGCCYHNCPDAAVTVFTDHQGNERGLCRFHRPLAIRAAESLGVTLNLRPPTRVNDATGGEDVPRRLPGGGTV